MFRNVLLWLGSLSGNISLRAFIEPLSKVVRKEDQKRIFLLKRSSNKLSRMKDKPQVVFNGVRAKLKVKNKLMEDI